MDYIPGSFPADAVYGEPYQFSTRLPIGDWNVLANGRIYTIRLEKDHAGSLSVQWPGTPIDNVAWDATTGKLTFTRFLPGRAKQHFTGYLLHRSEQDTLWRMAGTFDQPNLAASAGWYATQPGV